MQTPSGEPPVEPAPRAFATATGFVFQIVGGVLSFGGCCLWSLSGWFQDSAAAPVEAVSDYASNAPEALAMVGTTVTFVAGLGLFATGLGLQGEHPRSGVAALWVSGVLVLGWLACTVGFLLSGGSLVQCAVAVIMLGVGVVLFLLAGNSARELRLHPPPADRSVVTDAFLESQKRNRHL